MTPSPIELAHLDDRSLLGVMLGDEGDGLADHLIEVFGGLVGVLTASGSRLEAEARLRGGELPITGVKLDALQEAMKRSLRARVQSRQRVGSTSQLYAYLRASMATASREEVRVLYLDQSLGLIRDEALLGTVDRAPFYPREVLRRALELEASNLVIAHNHPSRSPTFSRDDIASTRALQTAAEAVGIELIDHLLIAGRRVVSGLSQGFVRSGLRHS